MNYAAFDRVSRRAAGLRDRRSLFAGLSAAAMAALGLPVAAEAKKHKHNNKNKRTKACKKRVKECREEFLPDCETEEDPAGCNDFVNNCCKKACDSFDKATDCLFD